MDDLGNRRLILTSIQPYEKTKIPIIINNLALDKTGKPEVWVVEDSEPIKCQDLNDTDCWYYVVSCVHPK